ncbi:hypothetical protein A5666_00140 [Mycolicibacterium fortuitum]|uniref:hypothetical protein n=1 Tax=Mycolicibacterium fortuitum TaxID=1766 RepID=UPI0007E936DF|nr:hypothetical protein [Mycolicibacterium fortuitum]OBA92987.1 hypothetical protein A5665_10780 [Mycolicibacterium fortuitum]OBI66936.1 hypothetical protein A5666_00140 [Mycolicibacterium fortuitum]
MTVDELRALLAGLPGQMPVLVSGYEAGFAPVAHGGVVEVQELDHGGELDYCGRFVTPAEAAEELDGRGSDWLYMVGGEPPKPVGEPVTAVVLSREGR